MSFNIESPKRIQERDLETASVLTAAGFGRDADEHNYKDTCAHLESADHLQIIRSNKEMIGFAAYRRVLWR